MKLTMMENIDKIPVNGCSGCTACYSSCPTAAIKMTPDNQGFLYPIIDYNLCVNCGKCLKVCPFQQETLNSPMNKVLAVKHVIPDERLSSASGGFAAALSERTLSSGGKVYGTILDDNFTVKTVAIKDQETAKQLKGSKYVQTTLGNSFKEIAKDLTNDTPVTFFGTSCHVDGLLHFLELERVNIDRLVTVDFLCHGVPSPLLFKEYCSYASRSRKLTTYLFRTKVMGWGTGSNLYAPTLIYNKQKKIDTPLARAWIDLFFSNNCLRPHCYKCPYASAHKRSADLTMADFWGLKNVLPDFFDTDGVSLVLINSSKGFETITNLENIIAEPCDLETSVARQANFFAPSQKPLTYTEFWDNYSRKGFSYILHHYTRYNPIGYMKYVIKKILKKV